MSDNEENIQPAEDNAPQQATKASKFMTRAVVGVGYAVLVLVCLLMGRWATTALLCVFAWQCCNEFYKMMRMAGRMPNELIGLAAAVAFPIAANISYLYSGVAAFLLAIATGVWYVLTPRANISDVALTVFGPMYTSLLFTSILKFRAVDPGIMGGILTFAVMASIWVNDSFAYIFGSRFGRTKLAPKISPNKSWEGFFGGMLGSVLVWVLISLLGLMPVPVPMAILTGIVLGIFGVIGDLFESRIKRSVGVKDSGNIMPGHGGLLDRHDSMLFGVMAAAFVLKVGGLL
ncbi:MAG: phosphatidate cytidylyltransferase [Atopobiaceae bacterium]|nr:phosphatidate cytidylyltransferase [Atopobiaceae bacterium]